MEDKLFDRDQAAKHLTVTFWTMRNRSALFLNEAIAAAEAEGNGELVANLLRAKQREARRLHEQRVREFSKNTT